MQTGNIEEKHASCILLFGFCFQSAASLFLAYKQQKQTNKQNIMDKLPPVFSTLLHNFIHMFIDHYSLSTHLPKPSKQANKKQQPTVLMMPTSTKYKAFQRKTVLTDSNDSSIVFILFILTEWLLMSTCATLASATEVHQVREVFKRFLENLWQLLKQQKIKSC